MKLFKISFLIVLKYNKKVGVTMAQTNTDLSLLESCVRTVLNLTAPRFVSFKKREIYIESAS